MALSWRFHGAFTALRGFHGASWLALETDEAPP
jgi:hypothetical protein